ncbi:hypothetical protein KM043_000234 [Ampulex compressa]|nr:hypothetical protein KM043_000234 [Ampulex compressa]
MTDRYTAGRQRRPVRFSSSGGGSRGKKKVRSENRMLCSNSALSKAKGARSDVVPRYSFYAKPVIDQKSMGILQFAPRQTRPERAREAETGPANTLPVAAPTSGSMPDIPPIRFAAIVELPPNQNSSVTPYYRVQKGKRNCKGEGEDEDIADAWTRANVPLPQDSNYKRPSFSFARPWLLT